MARLATAEVLQAIALAGEVTRGSLADRLNSNTQTVRHHLRLLLRSGDIVVTRQTKTHASPLLWYGVPNAHAAWKDHTDSLRQRIYMAAQAELKTLLDEWGEWTRHRMPHVLLEDVDRRVTALPTPYRAAVASAHNAANSWRRFIEGRDAAYEHGILRLMPVEKRSASHAIVVVSEVSAAR